jgi:hypothetical protein
VVRLIENFFKHIALRACNTEACFAARFYTVTTVLNS